MTRLQTAKERYDRAMEHARKRHQDAIHAAGAAYNNASATAWEEFLIESGQTNAPLAREVHQAAQRARRGTAN